ncbi:rhodanese-related sulfurtransferase [Salmonella enterica subsp. enterica]|nr:rhodanese-related sulfurtransferase [Salmonella enterica subsp. enterica serovar Enteritidis]
MSKSTLERIQDWYLSNCDGEWEHVYGFEIETLDNPGWRVTIDLTDTPLETKPFEELKHGNDEPDDDDWFVIWVKNDVESSKVVFNGAAGPRYLERVLEEFLKFAGA